MIRKLLFVTVAAGVLVGGVSVAVADPNLTNVRAHRHFVLTPSDELVQVGPRLCDDASLQTAFNQFHYNVHHSFSSPTTPVPTLGPQDGAPGLHNSQGADLVIRPCSFTG
jgi:hypothetical protein